MSSRVRLERERLTITPCNQGFTCVRERLTPLAYIRERLRERLNGQQPFRMERVRIKEPKRLTILEIENGKCRYPIGRANHGINEHLFCGNDVTPPRNGGSPRVYCDWHHSIAHSQRLPELPYDSTGLRR